MKQCEICLQVLTWEEIDDRETCVSCSLLKQAAQVEGLAIPRCLDQRTFPVDFLDIDRTP